MTMVIHMIMWINVVIIMIMKMRMVMINFVMPSSDGSHNYETNILIMIEGFLIMNHCQHCHYLLIDLDLDHHNGWLTLLSMKWKVLLSKRSLFVLASLSLCLFGLDSIIIVMIIIITIIAMIMIIVIMIIINRTTITISVFWVFGLWIIWMQRQLIIPLPLASSSSNYLTRKNTESTFFSLQFQQFFRLKVRWALMG